MTQDEEGYFIIPPGSKLTRLECETCARTLMPGIDYVWAKSEEKEVTAGGGSKKGDEDEGWWERHKELYPETTDENWKKEHEEIYGKIDGSDWRDA